MYDEVSLGDVDDFSELADYLDSYSTDYFIGLESEKGWEEAVVRKVPHLFSLGRDPEKVKLKFFLCLFFLIIAFTFSFTDCRTCTLLTC